MNTERELTSDELDAVSGGYVYDATYVMGIAAAQTNDAFRGRYQLRLDAANSVGPALDRKKCSAPNLRSLSWKTRGAVRRRSFWGHASPSAARRNRGSLTAEPPR